MQKEIFASRLSALMKNRNMKAADLSRLSDGRIKSASISQWVHAKNPPSEESLAILTEILGVEADYFESREEPAAAQEGSLELHQYTEKLMSHISLYSNASPGSRDLATRLLAEKDPAKLSLIGQILGI